jgi:uncharacterized repeat protein (TIGR04052 family)
MRFIALLLILLTAGRLAAQDDTITLRFAATVGEYTAACGETYTGVDDAEISFNDFRFYVSNIQLLTGDGDTVPLELDQDGLWQYENVALLDFEDATSGCSEAGTEAMNTEIVGTAPAGEYVGLQFDMGVPFELNHQDVTMAQSPLNIAAMWWNWQGGYKFIRIDVMIDGELPWNIHLGSTGCASVAAVMAPDEPCTRPNITTIVFEDFDFESDVIVADLGGLLEGLPLYDSTPMPPGCMSGLDDPDCEALYPNFGLSLEDGGCPDGDCSGQTFFRVDDDA